MGEGSWIPFNSALRDSQNLIAGRTKSRLLLCEHALRAGQRPYAPKGAGRLVRLPERQLPAAPACREQRLRQGSVPTPGRRLLVCDSSQKNIAEGGKQGAPRKESKSRVLPVLMNCSET